MPPVNPPTPVEFVNALSDAESEGFVKLKKTFGSWNVSLTKKGRAAFDLLRP
jgi:hypothetical protein